MTQMSLRGPRSEVRPSTMAAIKTRRSERYLERVNARVAHARGLRSGDGSPDPAVGRTEGLLAAAARRDLRSDGGDVGRPCHTRDTCATQSFAL